MMPPTPVPDVPLTGVVASGLFGCFANMPGKLKSSAEETLQRAFRYS
jgi:hypothetical protein